MRLLGGCTGSSSDNGVGIFGSRARTKVGSAGTSDWATTLASDLSAITPINAFTTDSTLAFKQAFAVDGTRRFFCQKSPTRCRVCDLPQADLIA